MSYDVKWCKTMRCMVIGASGYLGNTIYKRLQLKSNISICGTCHKKSNQEFVKLDLTNALEIAKIIQYKPDVIIWSVCDFEDEMILSQVGLNAIIENLNANVRFIYVSTTIGKGRDQAEDTKPHYRLPDEYLSKYINGKIEGEKIVRRHINHVIVRPGSIYGYAHNGKMDLRMERLLEIYKNGITYSRTANMYASFVQVLDLANAIIEFLDNDFKGTINIAGEKAVSYYDFNKHLANILNISDQFIMSDYKSEEIYNNLNCNLRKTILTTDIREIV